MDRIRRKMLSDVGGNIGRKPVLGLPVEIMRGVGRVGDVERVNAASLLRGDALENPFGARALAADGDPWIFGFECSGEALSDVELQRAIIGDLALLARSFDQCRRHTGRRWRGRPDRLGEQRPDGKPGRGLEHLAPRPLSISHGVPHKLHADFVAGAMIDCLDYSKERILKPPLKARSGPERTRRDWLAMRVDIP